MTKPRQRRTQGSRHGRERARAEYLGGSTVRFHYKCGHYFTEVLMQRAMPRGPGSPKKEPRTPRVVAMLCRGWARDGVNVRRCVTCARKRRAD